jgi:hypothetical protein
MRKGGADNCGAVPSAAEFEPTAPEFGRSGVDDHFGCARLPGQGCRSVDHLSDRPHFAAGRPLKACPAAGDTYCGAHPGESRAQFNGCAGFPAGCLGDAQMSDDCVFS